MRYSDRFANCVRPEIQERVTVHGQTVTIQKSWERYTNEEKARAINYKFGCGHDVVEFLLHLETRVNELLLENEALKKKVSEAEGAAISIDARVKRLSDDTVESLKHLGDRVTAIDTKF